MELMSALKDLEGVAHVSTLVSRGVPPSAIRSALRLGAVDRPRRGWIASPSAEPDVRAAVAAGGRLGCASAARSLGLWVLDEPDSHISIPRHSGHARPPEGTIVHWRGAEWGTGHGTRDPIGIVIRDVADCLPRLGAICTIDSALNKRLISTERVVELLADTRRGRSLIPFLDARAESGLETAFRVGAVDVGIRVRPQVEIPGVGRVDFLIGDRLVVECDGRQHDTQDGRRRDRRRDLMSLASGHVVLRLDAPQILDEWGLTIAVLRELMARGEHRWRAVHRNRGLSSGG